jgi:site-specific DNA-methyltransferase (adenine-specific)
VFLNPPYGRNLKDWVRKGYEEGQKDNTMVVMLIPARTDTQYWHDYVMKADEIRFVRGRIKFGDGTNSAPFPSAVVVFRKTAFDGPRITGMERP